MKQYDKMLKGFLLLVMITIATTAFAFGGGGSGRKTTTYELGLVAIGVHFGGKDQANIDFNNCSEESSISCVGGTCGDHATYNSTKGKCVCDTGYFGVALI